ICPAVDQPAPAVLSLSQPGAERRAQAAGANVDAPAHPRQPPPQPAWPDAGGRARCHEPGADHRHRGLAAPPPAPMTAAPRSLSSAPARARLAAIVLTRNEEKHL